MDVFDEESNMNAFEAMWNGLWEPDHGSDPIHVDLLDAFVGATDFPLSAEELRDNDFYNFDEDQDHLSYEELMEAYLAFQEEQWFEDEFGDGDYDEEYDGDDDENDGDCEEADTCWNWEERMGADGWEWTVDDGDCWACDNDNEEHWEWEGLGGCDDWDDLSDSCCCVDWKWDWEHDLWVWMGEYDGWVWNYDEWAWNWAGYDGWVYNYDTDRYERDWLGDGEVRPDWFPHEKELDNEFYAIYTDNALDTFGWNVSATQLGEWLETMPFGRFGHELT